MATKNTAPTLLRGFRDVLPEETELWEKMRSQAAGILRDYGFFEINVPILEATSLFRRSIGEATDIVEKEMFTFTDRSRDSVTMRPEITAGIARAYIEHGMFNRPQPLKLFSFGPLFRYDRPQAGRYRQFHQLDLEIIGNAKEVADAEIIYLSYLICSSLGLEVTIQVNSLGNAESRKEYIKILRDYYRSKRRFLCEDCKRRLLKNTLRLLDCKQADCQGLIAGAPQLLDHLDEESKKHFVRVLEFLDQSEVPYVLNPYIVRGLDYYNRTTFEIWPSFAPSGGATEGKPAETAPLAIGGGGRYDGLMEAIGGRPTPAVGMAFGWERLADLVRGANTELAIPARPDVFFATLGEEAAKHAFAIFEKLRRAGIKVVSNFAKEGLKPQLELADKQQVSYAVILGQKEMLDGTIIIRDMENGIQEVVDLKKVCEEIKKRLVKKQS